MGKIGKLIMTAMNIVLLILLFPRIVLAGVQFYSEVDPPAGSKDDTYTFTVTCAGCTSLPQIELRGSADFSARYLGPQTVYMSGQGIKLSAVYHLTPMREGVLETPQAEMLLGGQRLTAAPIKVRVTAGAPDLPLSDDLILRQSVNKESVYRGEQLVNTIEVYISRRVAEPRLEDAPLEKFWQEPLGKEEHRTRQLEGRQYQLVQMRKALFPLISGEVELPPRKILGKLISRNGQKSPFGSDLFDPFGSIFTPQQVKEVTLSSNALAIRVKEPPLPPPELKDWQLTDPIVGVTEVRVDVDRAPINVGASRTITYVVTSLGNLNPLKELPLRSSQEYRVYAESPAIENFENSGALISRRTFKVSLVPTRPGKVVIPALVLPYFNPDEVEYRFARSEALSFEVQGVGGIEPSPAVEAQPVAREDLDATEDRSLFAQFLRTVSGTAMLFAVLVLGLLVMGVRLVWRFFHEVTPRRDLRRKIDEADSVEKLTEAMRMFFRLHLSIDTENLSPDELKVSLKASSLSQEQQFVLGTLIDRISAARFGGSSEPLTALRGDLARLARSY